MSDNRDYIVANGEFRELIRQMAILSTKVENFERRLDEFPKNDAATCAVHSQQIRAAEKRLAKMEDQITGDRKITVGVSAITAGIILALKWAVWK